MEKRAFEISWVSLWRILFFITFAFLLYKGTSILLGLFLALVISSGLEFMVDFLEKRRIPRTLGVIIIFLTFFLVLVVVIYAVIPLIVVDLSNILSKFSEGGTWWAPIISERTTQSLTAVLNRISEAIFSNGISPIGAISDFFGGVALAVSILISSFYFSLSKDGVNRFIRAVFPTNQEDTVLKIYERSSRRVGLWFRSQILLSITMALLVWIALFLLGVRHAFLLGILAGLFELVPFVGPILSGAVAFIVAWGVAPILGIYTIIVFILIHQVESHFLVPLLIGRNLGLHPVIVITALLIGVELGGILGILISVPGAVVIQEVVEEWSERRRPRAA